MMSTRQPHSWQFRELPVKFFGVIGAPQLAAMFHDLPPRPRIAPGFPVLHGAMVVFANAFLEPTIRFAYEYECAVALMDYSAHGPSHYFLGDDDCEMRTGQRFILRHCLPLSPLPSPGSLLPLMPPTVWPHFATYCYTARENAAPSEQRDPKYETPRPSPRHCTARRVRTSRDHLSVVRLRSRSRCSCRAKVPKVPIHCLAQ